VKSGASCVTIENFSIQLIFANTWQKFCGTFINRAVERFANLSVDEILSEILVQIIKLVIIQMKLYKIFTVLGKVCLMIRTSKGIGNKITVVLNLTTLRRKLVYFC
jgi:hypothetical protein